MSIVLCLSYMYTVLHFFKTHDPLVVIFGNTCIATKTGLQNKMYTSTVFIGMDAPLHRHFETEV